MPQVIRITGTIVVHALEDAEFDFVLNRQQLIIEGGLSVSDRRHQIAAHIIARELQLTVEWQDICGLKHFVEPDSELVEQVSFFDPRDTVVLNESCVN